MSEWNVAYSLLYTFWRFGLIETGTKIDCKALDDLVARHGVSGEFKRHVE